MRKQQSKLASEAPPKSQIKVGRRIFDDAAAPVQDPQRIFRDAWVESGNVIGIDMGKARKIHVARIRAERAPLFTDLDIAFMRADETGDEDEKRRIIEEKATLRDVTKDPRIDAARTLDDLGKITLKALTVGNS